MKSNKSKEKGNLLKGVGMMGTCCLLPIIITSVIPLLGLSLGTNTILSSLSALICPIMMISMVFVMGRTGKGCCSKEKDDEVKE